MSSPGAEAREAGWRWLAGLPRAVTAHAERGDDPLAAVRALLTELGDPHAGLRVLHIAGSKGKGSTALFAERLLGALGQRTFTFTSPHLERWTERLRLAGREVEPDTALAALEAVRAAGEARGIVPGFFEALTVAGLWLAAREGVDCAIVECGVGGRADATNIVHPAATVITGIEREHVERLGHALETIACEKAGIVKPGAPLIAPALPPGIDTVLARAAAAAGVEHRRLHERDSPPAEAADDDSMAEWCLERGWLTATGPGWRVRTPMAAPGRCAAGNAALALNAVAALGLASGAALARAADTLATTALPGRSEIVSQRPWVMIDSAHTAASARALADTVSALEPTAVHLLLSCSSGKDLDAVLPPLLALAASVTTTRADRDYSVAADELARRVRHHRPDLDVVAANQIDVALALASGRAAPGALVLATGSVYLAGAVRAALG